MATASSQEQHPQQRLRRGAGSGEVDTGSPPGPRARQTTGGEPLVPPVWAWLLGLSFAIYAGVATWILTTWDEAPTRFRFDPTPIVESGLAILLHLGAALIAFVLGCWILALPKGTGLHKPLGWIWVAAMATAAVSSFFIRVVIPGNFSPIHALSAWVVLALPMGVAAIRARKVSAHRRLMTGLFIGGMGIAGLFTLLPGRLLWSVFFAV